MFKADDLTGKRFGYLTVIERSANHIRPNGYKEVMWKCRCDCGKEVIRSAKTLKRYNRCSCGCMKSTVTREHATTHGCTNTRLFRIWSGIKTRCNNPNDQHWDDYGGRGITICKEWKNDFVAFKNWAESNGYSDDLTIDRINVNGNYCPENCRWVNWKVQENNKRTSVKINYHGELYTMSELADMFGVKLSRIKGARHRGKLNEQYLDNLKG